MWERLLLASRLGGASRDQASLQQRKSRPACDELSRVESRSHTYKSNDRFS
jgi:hypothetical protein